jgi:hypothetical protein
MRLTRFRFAALTGLLALAPLLAGAAGQTSAGAAAPMEISFLMEIRSGEESTWFLDQVEERFNVRIVPNGVYHGDKEKVSLLLATGECPDLFCPIDPFDGLAQGLTRTIPVEMIQEHAPQYTALLDDFYPIGWLLGQSPDDPTEYVALHMIGENADTLLTFATFRSDWAENVGFTVPNLDQAMQIDPLGRVFYLDEDFTLDQFEGLLKAFRDQDPDGNGKNDTIPYGAYGRPRLYGSWPWGAIQGALGVPTTNLDRNHYVDGELYIAHVSPRFREFTELVARWWDMGLIDSEFFTIDRGASWEKAATGAFGVYNSNYNYVGRIPSRPPDNMISDEDVANGVELVMFAPIGPRGEQFAGMYGTSYVRGQVQVMNKNLSEAKTERVMQIANTKYRLTDGTPEGIDLWIQWQYGYGEEGVHWEWRGEPYQSAIRAIPADERPADAPARGGFPTNYPNYSPVEYFAFRYPPQQADWILNHLFGDRVQGQTFATEYVDIFNETDFREVSGRRGEALQTMTAEFFAKAVAGEIDIDAEWDDYVARWMEAGGNELMAEIAKMPRWSDFF